MCLIINDNKNHQKKFNKRFKNGFVKLWKILVVNYSSNNTLTSPWKGKLYKAGSNVSDRKTKALTTKEKCRTRVDKGIHVYLSKKEAKNNLRFCHVNSVIVPVYCKEEDFVALGYEDAVFLRVKLLKKDKYDAIKKYRESAGKIYVTGVEYS